MKRGFTLVEVLVASAIGLVVLVGALTFQQHTAITSDSSQRKIEATGATAFAERRIRELVENARAVWVAPPDSDVIKSLARSEPPALMYADRHEIFYDPAARALFVDGKQEMACKLSAVEFALEGDTLRLLLSTDQSAMFVYGRPPSFRERSTVSTRIYLRPQADARLYQNVPQSPHAWCVAGDPIRY